MNFSMDHVPGAVSIFQPLTCSPTRYHCAMTAPLEHSQFADAGLLLGIGVELLPGLLWQRSLYRSVLLLLLITAPAHKTIQYNLFHNAPTPKTIKYNLFYNPPFYYFNTYPLLITSCFTYISTGLLLYQYLLWHNT